MLSSFISVVILSSCQARSFGACSSRLLLCTKSATVCSKKLPDIISTNLIFPDVSRLEAETTHYKIASSCCCCCCIGYQRDDNVESFSGRVKRKVTTSALFSGKKSHGPLAVAESCCRSGVQNGRDSWKTPTESLKCF